MVEVGRVGFGETGLRGIHRQIAPEQSIIFGAQLEALAPGYRYGEYETD
jgi:hypothetical protein